MMRPSDSLARAARDEYHSLRHSKPAWVPFFPPFTQSELPPPPEFLIDDKQEVWDEVQTWNSSQDKWTMKLVTGLFIGVTLAVASLIGVCIYPFDSQPRGPSKASASGFPGCFCGLDSMADRSSRQTLSRGMDISMQIAGDADVSISGNVGILVQNTEARLASCIVLQTAPEIQTWDWKAEGRRIEANATRSPAGDRTCVHFNETLPWPVAYVTMDFRYSQALNAPEDKAPRLPFLLSGSKPDQSHQPFAVFPFIDSFREDSGLGFSPKGLWAFNVTTPRKMTVEASADEAPIFDALEEHTAVNGSSDGILETHVFRTAASQLPELLLKSKT